MSKIDPSRIRSKIFLATVSAGTHITQILYDHIKV
ncbi:hypothetical protein ABHN84_19340 [Shewanella vesiculosa]|uniref:Uncharacterized protein n=1 Tax=Shewanella vesiculosa TaxID=518738 RepID=A0ABV0FUA4_9GAMM